MLKYTLILRQLTYPKRLEAFQRLCRAPVGLNTNELVDELGIADATLEYHVKSLIHCHLITKVRGSRGPGAPNTYYVAETPEAIFARRIIVLGNQWERNHEQ